MKGKKRLAFILLSLLTVFFAGIIFIQKICCYSTATNQGKQSCFDTVTLTAEEIISYSSQAHYATVKLFSQAFEDELYHGGKSPWPEVRPQLLKYWSSSL